MLYIKLLLIIKFGNNWFQKVIFLVKLRKINLNRLKSSHKIVQFWYLFLKNI